MPGCEHCLLLKTWLKTHNIPYTELSMDTDAKTELIMDNIFSDPPVLKNGDRHLVKEEIFGDEKLREDVVLKFLNSEQGVNK